MKMKILSNKITINAKKVFGVEKFLGLMFKSRNTRNLLFEFNKNESKKIHSLFVFFNFLAIWLDKNNRVIGYELVRPFRLLIKPKKSSSKLLEIPINKKNEKIIKFFR